jgi:hypothetical protein
VKKHEFGRTKWIFRGSVVDFSGVLEGPCIYTYVCIYTCTNRGMETYENQ